MATPILLEVCVDSIESATAAVQGGADRLEICGNFGLGGGTTPSFGLVQTIKSRHPGIPLMVMIRPRTGDFLYTEGEFTVMEEDIRAFSRIGITGVVLGALREDGRVDVPKTSHLVNIARGLDLEVTFHRAIDMTAGCLEAFRTLQEIPGISRVLTSGGGKSAPECMDTISALLQLATSRGNGGETMTVMPGSGINPRTVRQVVKRLLPSGLREIHMSGGSWMTGEMDYRPDGMGMGVGEGVWAVWRTNEDAVRQVREILDEEVNIFNARQ